MIAHLTPTYDCTFTAAAAAPRENSLGLFTRQQNEFDRHVIDLSHPARAGRAAASTKDAAGFSSSSRSSAQRLSRFNFKRLSAPIL